MTPGVARRALDFDSYIRDRAQSFSGRNWVFEHIDGWLSDQERSRFLLITGEPGSGKTALAARLAQFSSGIANPSPECHKLAPGFVSAMHFCVARAGTWIEPISFSRSISLQLAQTCPDFAQALIKAGDRGVNIQVIQSVQNAATVSGVIIENLVLTGLNAQTAFNAGVVGPLEEIYQQGFNAPIVILVDALDEALAYKGEIAIPQLLASIDTLPAQVRFILTSRRNQTIESELMNAEIFALSSEEFNADNDADVRAYIEARLAGTTQVASVDELSRQAGGNFQYVNFLLKQIEAGRALVAGELPPGLDSLYWDSLKRAVGNRNWEEEFAPVLGLLSVAYESLTESQLKVLSGLKEREISARLADLRAFIEESGVPRAYRFYHLSVVDFLRLREIAPVIGSLPNRFYLPAAEWHEQIARHYLPDGPASWTRWDDYGLRYTVSHMAEAARAESNGRRDSLVRQLVPLVTNSDFRARRQRDIDDMPALQRDLLEAVRCAALDQGPTAILLLVRSVLAVTAFRDEELKPRAVFDLAAEGQVERAARRLELFDVEDDWIRATLLIIAWLGARSDRTGAEALLAKIKAQPGPTQQLFDHVRAEINQAPPPINPLPLDPPHSEREVAALVDWFGGKGGDPEMLQRIVNDSFLNVSREMGAATGYFAEQDAPILVSFAAFHPGGDRYLHQYIAIHSGYQYAQYRNRSLWFVLASVLTHPNPKWIRDTARQLAETALAGSSLEFREALPLTVLALKAAAGDAGAAQQIEQLRDQAVTEASSATEPSARNFNLLVGSRTPPTSGGTGSTPESDDSWGAHRRRLAAHAQILARLKISGPEAFSLMLAAIAIKRGFAGFQAPASVLLADTALICDRTARTVIDSLLSAALESAQNIQDASFCLRVTSRCNALRERWWGALDLKQSVAVLTGNPRAPELCALHFIGEQFQSREPTGLPIPDDVRTADTLISVAAIYHLAISDLQRVNPWFDPVQQLALGSQVNIPDPGFATWIAARLSSELLADPTLVDSERVALMQLLVPVCVPNPTLLDTVLARLLLAARPDDLNVLNELESLVGPPHVRDVAAFEARIPA